MVVLFALSGCGGVESDDTASPSRPPATTASPPPPPPPSAHFTRANWDVLATDPESHQGATVDIVGRVWSAPERDDEGTLRFMMYVDPKKSEWETLVSFPDSSARIASDDYVRVKGTVHEAYTSADAMGESTVPLILANSVSKSTRP